MQCKQRKKAKNYTGNSFAFFFFCISTKNYKCYLLSNIFSKIVLLNMTICSHEKQAIMYACKWTIKKLWLSQLKMSKNKIKFPFFPDNLCIFTQKLSQATVILVRIGTWIALLGVSLNKKVEMNINLVYVNILCEE